MGWPQSLKGVVNLNVGTCAECHAKYFLPFGLSNHLDEQAGPSIFCVLLNLYFEMHRTDMCFRKFCVS